jgi:hypothetical protein
MKTYSGSRTAGATVVLVDGRPLDPRLELRDFQAGFEWGYEGSGPSQLALAILADHAGPENALGGWKTFMQTVVSELEGERWRLTSDEIDRRRESVAVVPMDLQTLLRKVRGES